MRPMTELIQHTLDLNNDAVKTESDSTSIAAGKDACSCALSNDLRQSATLADLASYAHNGEDPDRQGHLCQAS